MKEDVSVVLQRKAEQVRTGTEILMAQTVDWQVIKMYLSNKLSDLELTPTQQNKLERYQYIYNQLVSGKYTEQEVTGQVKKLYNVATAQAYEDITSAKEIFSTLFHINKRFELKIELEAARDMRRKAMELSDIKAAAAVQKNIVLLLKDLPEEIENPGELFEGHTFEFTFNPALLGAPPVDMKELLSAINAKRRKKISIDMFDEIPFEETPS